MIAVFSMTALVCGVMAMVIVLSVFNGFDARLKKQYVDVDPDLKIELREGRFFTISDDLIYDINNIPGVYACAEILEYKMFAKSLQNQQLVNVKGVNDHYLNVSNMLSPIDWNYYKHQKSVLERFIHPVIVSSAIQDSLLRKQYSQDLEFANIELFFFTNKKHRMFPVGANSLDIISPHKFGALKRSFATNQEFQNTIILHINTLRDCVNLPPTTCSSLELSVNHDHEAIIVKKELEKILSDNFIIKDREQQRPLVNKLIKTEKLAVYIIFTFILLITLLSVVTSLVVLLMQKQNDIQVLYFLGYSIKNIKNIFFFVGLFITCSSLLIGTGIGLFICWWQSLALVVELFGLKLSFYVPFFTDFGIYPYPVRINWLDILYIQLIVFFLGIVGSLIVSNTKRFYPN